MPNPKYIQGDVNPITVAVATAQAIALQDIISLISNTAVRGEDVTWDTDLATTQLAQVNGFVGVSMQQKTANVARVFGNSADNVLVVATGGVWEFDAASATFEVGALVGVAKATGNALVSQKIVGVGSEGVAIGRVFKRGASLTRVQVILLSKLAPFARSA